jgi:cytochrome c-type biogenesis protein CcmE
MFQNRRSRERMVKWLGIFVAVAMVLSLVLPFLLSGR